MAYQIKTQREIRAAFWRTLNEECPGIKRVASWSQNQYPTDVRVAFVDFVDHLTRDGQISETLAQRATL